MSDNSKRNNGIVNKILIAVILIMMIVMAIFVHVVLFSGIYSVMKNEKNVSVERIYHVCDYKDVKKYNELEKELRLANTSLEDDAVGKANEIYNKEKALAKEIQGRNNFNKDATCQYLVVKIGILDEIQQDNYTEELKSLSESGVNPSIYLDDDFRGYSSDFN